MIKMMNVSSILLLVIGGSWISVTLHTGSYTTFCFGWPLSIRSTTMNRRNREKVAYSTTTSTSVIIWSGSNDANSVSSSTKSTATDDYSGSASVLSKQRLFQLLDGTPPNEPTPPSLTLQILDEIRRLEKESSSAAVVKDANNFLSSLAGNWELIWTAQDANSPEYRNANPIRRWINPLENQSYSNNPSGRKNPILPTTMQDRLEQFGVLSSSSEVSAIDSNSSSQEQRKPGIVSTQSIDVKKQRVRNVVRFTTNLPQGSSVIQGTLTVDIAFVPSSTDFRRINVQFEKCRLAVSKSPIDITIPLGIIGPTGWLRTTYIDQDIRISRGHKGSVFLLLRTSNR